MSSQPVSDEATKEVLAQYGLTMGVVQAWEFQLSALAGSVRMKLPQDQPSSQRAAARALEKGIVHMAHLTTKASASELRNLLRNQPGSDLIPEPIFDEVDALIGWRDFLAHRYVRTRLYLSSGGPDHLALRQELLDLARAFSNSMGKLSEVTKQVIRRTNPPTDVPEDVDAAFQNIANLIMHVQPPRFASTGPDGRIPRVLGPNEDA